MTVVNHPGNRCDLRKILHHHALPLHNRRIKFWILKLDCHKISRLTGFVLSDVYLTERACRMQSFMSQCQSLPTITTLPTFANRSLSNPSPAKDQVRGSSFHRCCRTDWNISDFSSLMIGQCAKQPFPKVKRLIYVLLHTCKIYYAYLPVHAKRAVRLLKQRNFRSQGSTEFFQTKLLPTDRLLCVPS